MVNDRSGCNRCLLFCSWNDYIFFRPVFIAGKVVRYVKKYHKDFYENHNHLFYDTGFGRIENVFQVLKRFGLDDPKIEAYKKEWDKALKQLLLVAAHH